MILADPRAGGGARAALDFGNGRAYGSSMPGMRGARRAAAAVVLALLSAPALTLGGPALPQAEAAATLEALLAKAAEYCRRLESSAFDFVCREEIRETIDPKLDAAEPPRPSDPGTSPFLGPTLTVRRVKKVKRSFVYDYQCVRAGRAIREVRTQLEENGKRKVVPNAELRTSIVVFGTVLLGPVGLFGEQHQPDYAFAVAGRERVGDVEAVILDAKPKPGAPPSRNLYGRAWIDPATGHILKIEWSESRVGRFEAFVQRGKAFKRTPRLTIRSDFSAEKNGLRFPSRLEVEEAYLNDKGQAFVRSRTEVVYKDFQFFTVTFDVRR